MYKMKLIGFLMFLCTATYAQSKNFTGTWSLSDQQSISGTLYSNGVPKQIKVTLNDSSLNMEKTTANSDQDVTIMEKANLDGKPTATITSSKRKKVVTIRRDNDENNFTEIVNFYMAED